MELRCALFLPSTFVLEDYQGIREPIQVVVPKVKGWGLTRVIWHKAPDGFFPLEIWENWYPLQKQVPQQLVINHSHTSDTLLEALTIKNNKNTKRKVNKWAW